MQTASGQWRKVDAYGNLYVSSSKRPEHCVITMWKEWQRSNAAIRRRGLTEMKRLVDENATLLTQEVAVETLLQESKEKSVLTQSTKKSKRISGLTERSSNVKQRFNKSSTIRKNHTHGNAQSAKRNTRTTAAMSSSCSSSKSSSSTNCWFANGS